MFDGIDWGRADVWIAIAVLMVATAATRSTFWLVGHHITIPRRVGEMLRYAPACALAAIIAADRPSHHHSAPRGRDAALCAGLRAGRHHRARHADGGAASAL